MSTCRTRLKITCAASALLVGLAPMSNAMAADQPTSKGPVPVLIDPSWYTEGEVEVGGRIFLNRPQRGAMPGMGYSLAKYYEYSTLKPGPFSNIWLAAGTRDGKYRVEIFGKNIGYTDQSYGLYADKAGEHYFNFSYDQTPHVYSTSAQTVFGGVGTNVLWVPPGAGNALKSTTGAAQWGALNAWSHATDIGIVRATTSADYRWTPNDWDVRANFSNTQRTGTQVDAAMSGFGIYFQTPKPVNDATKNYGLSAEYAGTSPWDKQFTIKFGYTGSAYTDNYKYYVVDNPTCGPGGAAFSCASTGTPVLMQSLAPSNFANGVSATLALDLPYKSRYVGTFSFNNMRQNDPFLPFTVNPNLGNFPGGYPTFSGLPTASSLNGNVNTYLANNVLTTTITPELKSKVTYRYYNFDNMTPEIGIPGYVEFDTTIASPGGATSLPTRSITMKYVKQNAGAELNWRPSKQWNLGAAYGYEQYDWTREAATSTYENSGKVFADWKPATWVDARASALFASRTNNNYNYLANLGAFQFSSAGGTLGTPGNWFVTPNQQAFYLSARERTQINLQLGVTVLPDVRVTPSIQYQNDYYPLNNNAAFLPRTLPAALPTSGIWQEGLNWNRALRPGVEISYAMNPTTRFYGFYMYEHSSQGMNVGAPQVVALTTTTQPETVQINDTIHTFKVGFESKPIDRLDLRSSYTFSRGHNTQPLSVISTPTFYNYQPSDTVMNRFDVVAKYTFADDWVRQMGLDGKLSASLAYAMEQNRVTNWQSSTLNYVLSQAYTSANSTFLGFSNPNYTVHRLAGSLAYKW